MNENSSSDGVFDCAVRGSGGVKMISSTELLLLHDQASKNDVLVDSIECFKVTENYDFPYVDLTLTPNDFHRLHSGLSWADKILISKKEILHTINECSKIGGVFKFNARVSSEKDWE